ncbi:MAG: FKBP-type peptidyl-prolyl cis-trans isomerase [Flavobacteriales bacterium]|nr:FKBP-type peptidyl-prolyl cis-trans isomerase [Flavobacteriales bacterium]MBK9514216.1 FKBP-type peptidyl-prolyl cis-trans isomerase [Flavobacteriales bacterium]
MTVRIVNAALAMTFLSACSQGQKGPVELKNEMDSVSYAIGADIGANFKRGKLDSVNIDAMALGLRHGLDSNTMMDQASLEQVVQGYMMKLQERRMAEEQVKGEENRVAGEAFLAENGKKPGVTTTESGLQYEVITMGKGAKPLASDQVKVHYTGTLIDGTKFDSSVDRGEPATFPVGGVIRGWVEAIQLMPVGSKWKLYIPSDLAYGPSGGPGGTIPGNSTLIFEVELLDIVK